MKNLITLISIMLCTAAVAQNNCSKYYLSKPGSKVILKHLDKRDELMMRSEYIVNGRGSSGMNVDFNLWDEDGEIMTHGSFFMGCSNNTTYLAPETITTNLLRQYPDLEYEVVINDAVGIPNNLSIGQELQSGSVSVKIDAQIGMISWDSIISDRNVIDYEEITTPAGTFNCYVISYTNTLRGRLASRTYSSTLWIAEDVGIVKEVTKKRNGRVVSTTILEQYLQ